MPLKHVLPVNRFGLETTNLLNLNINMAAQGQPGHNNQQ